LPEPKGRDRESGPALSLSGGRTDGRRHEEPDMADVRLVNPPGSEAIYQSYKFSQATVAGGFVEVSGQVGLAADFSIPDDIREQARNAFTNVKNVLEAAGSGLAQVMHLTQYFTDIRDVPAVDEVFSEFFPENYPARTVVQVVALVLPQLKLEIQVRAVLKD
jgi:enamine deaminase RidA (YjgF/YER057c/UK114 family)